MGNRRRRRPEPYGHLYGTEQPTGNADPRRLGGSITGPGGPHDAGAVVLDTTDCVLMSSIEVCQVDGVKDGHGLGRFVYLVAGGRINKTTDQVNVGLMMPWDGAAAIVSELLALADRAGRLDELVDRIGQLDADNLVSLYRIVDALNRAGEER